MAKKMGKTLAKAQRKLRPRPARNLGDAADVNGIINLIVDPCQAPMVHGYAMTTTGIVQRFTKFLTPAATSENAFAYVWNPQNQTTTAITQKLATGTGAPANVTTTGPGEAYIEVNADAAATLAACIEVLYTGTLVNRKGYIGVCQGNQQLLADVATGTADLPTLLATCHAVTPVPSSTIELKWSPSLKNFTANNAGTEASGSSDNFLMVVAIGVNPNDFVIRFTSVVEYVPKFTLGLPAPRVTRRVPPAIGERVVTFLDSLGNWWHNVGNMAAGVRRLGYSTAYGAGQVARTVAAGRSAAQALRTGVSLLALTG